MIVSGVEYNNHNMVEYLQECVDFGGPIRDAFGRILIDERMYSRIWKVVSSMKFWIFFQIYNIM